MLRIRLQRVGRVHEPTFRVVVTDSQNSTKSGRILEVVGAHDPRHKDQTQLDVDRIKYWISVGAQPTDTLHNMFISKKIIEGKKINVLPRKRPIVKAAEEGKADAAKAPAAVATPAEATPAPEVAAEAPVETAPVEAVATAPAATPAA